MRLTDCRSRRKASVARKESLRSRKVVVGEAGVSGTPGGHLSATVWSVALVLGVRGN